MKHLSERSKQIKTKLQSRVVSNKSTSFINFKLATNKGSPSYNEETEGEIPVEVKIIETKTFGTSGETEAGSFHIPS